MKTFKIKVGTDSIQLTDAENPANVFNLLGEPRDKITDILLWLRETEPPLAPVRYFFNLTSLGLRALRYPSEKTLAGVNDLEVQESCLPYLKKPEGEWEFRKVEVGDALIVCKRSDDKHEYHHGGVAGAVTSFNVDFLLKFLSGYRWCRPRVVFLQPSVEPKPHWVEYAITVTENRTFGYRCKIKHIHNSELGIHKLPSVVGFGGVQFEGGDPQVWSMCLCLTISGYKSTGDSKQIPATPIKARFWVEG